MYHVSCIMYDDGGDDDDDDDDDDDSRDGDGDGDDGANIMVGWC